MLAGFHQPVRRSRSRSEKGRKVNGRSLPVSQIGQTFFAKRGDHRGLLSHPSKCSKRGPEGRLLDHLIGTREERGRYVEAKSLRRNQVPEQFRVAWPIAQETSRFDVIPHIVGSHAPSAKMLTRIRLVVMSGSLTT